MAEPVPQILVLEDDKIQLLTLRVALRGCGNLVEFSESREALAFARAHPVDLAIVDRGLAGQELDGTGFIRELRLVDPILRVILRTGADPADLAEGTLEALDCRLFRKATMPPAQLREFAVLDIAETRRRRAAS